MKKTLLIALTFLLTPACLIAQDPHRFDADIAKFSKLSVPSNGELAVFTGSSSIRFWDYLKEDCDGMQVVNTGFGGSHMSDLLYFLDQTVLRFKPGKVYIYEGDNDIADEKNPEAVLATTKQVVERILASNPEITIHFISAKPSPSRWKYRNQYVAFNSLLKNYCDTHPQLSYIDVWKPMLDDTGRPDPQIFVSDSLHMNRKGYLLWKEIVCQSME